MNLSDEESRLRVVRQFTGDQRHRQRWQVDGLSAALIAGSAAADDCAVLELSGSGSLVIGSDYVRGTGFRLFELGHLSYFDLGWYVAVANISDVAAMGARPVGFLSVIRYPKSLPTEDFAAILEGIAAACEVHGTNPLGGDIGGAERVLLSGTAFGIAPPGGTLRRNAARPGDVLAVTGPVGTPAAALFYFDRVRQTTRIGPEFEDELLAAWRRPAARVDVGGTLAESGVRCAQDISDGLKDTVHQLCGASDVGCVLNAGEIPMETSVTEVAAAAGVDALGLALGASVDFELACAVAADDFDRVREAVTEAGGQLLPIGRFTEDAGVFLKRADGRLEPLPGATWDHTSDDPAELLARASARQDATDD